MPTVVSGSFHSRSLAQPSAASGLSCGLDGARCNRLHLDSRAQPWAGWPRDDGTRIDDLISGNRVQLLEVSEVTELAITPGAADRAARALERPSGGTPLDEQLPLVRSPDPLRLPTQHLR